MSFLLSCVFSGIFPRALLPALSLPSVEIPRLSLIPHLLPFLEYSREPCVSQEPRTCLLLSPLSHPQGFNWTLFVQTVLSSVKIKLLPNEEVVVYGIPYLQHLEDIIDRYSAR